MGSSPFAFVSWTRITSATVVCFLGMVAASIASAATWNVSAGALLGAYGVDVGGTSYDVEFVDGTCIALFEGCDSPDDFAFDTAADAILASQALLDQVFLDGPAGAFDTQPFRTNGCDAAGFCTTLTPFLRSGSNVLYIAATNQTTVINDTVSLTSDSIPASFSLSGSLNFGWARWTPVATVPEPGTGMLVSVGLIVLAARRRRVG